ncbi:unnamed protein product [Cyprideis torosa]|uniref:Uncharacterized protein n=1 Tax=Cyprideis torosa TaxID=163714 RepID=A0A7R8WIG5_9CRUS|nr:unnamed protein product [Cyprideis torosa]CAG0898778.1 unnamed protein product [Cyprideis torosa]
MVDAGFSHVMDSHVTRIRSQLWEKEGELPLRYHAAAVLNQRCETNRASVVWALSWSQSVGSHGGLHPMTLLHGGPCWVWHLLGPWGPGEEQGCVKNRLTLAILEPDWATSQGEAHPISQVWALSWSQSVGSHGGLHPMMLLHGGPCWVLHLLGPWGPGEEQGCVKNRLTLAILEPDWATSQGEAHPISQSRWSPGPVKRVIARQPIEFLRVNDHGLPSVLYPPTALVSVEERRRIQPQLGAPSGDNRRAFHAGQCTGNLSPDLIGRAVVSTALSCSEAKTAVNRYSLGCHRVPKPNPLGGQLVYPEFHFRPPPPSYQASMQEYRLRLLLLDRHHSAPPATSSSGIPPHLPPPPLPIPPPPAVSPPPTYRSNISSTLSRPALSVREGSRPPSYRSRASSTLRHPLHSRDPPLSPPPPSRPALSVREGSRPPSYRSRASSTLRHPLHSRDPSGSLSTDGLSPGNTVNGISGNTGGPTLHLRAQHHHPPSSHLFPNSQHSSPLERVVLMPTQRANGRYVMIHVWQK